MLRASSCSPDSRGSRSPSTIADYDASSEPETLLHRFVYGDNLDEPLIMVSASGGLTYLYADRLGSITARADETGEIISRSKYSPYGLTEGEGADAFGFTGQRYDSETGLYYFKNRYYSPSLGRFLQPDPVPSLNHYLYVSNDPLNIVDELGLDDRGTNCAGWANNTDRTPSRPFGPYSGPYRSDFDGKTETFKDYYKRTGWECEEAGADCPDKKCYRKKIVWFASNPVDKRHGLDPMEQTGDSDWMHWHEVGYDVSSLTHKYCGWSEWLRGWSEPLEFPPPSHPLAVNPPPGLEYMKKYCCYQKIKPQSCKK